MANVAYRPTITITIPSFKFPKGEIKDFDQKDFEVLHKYGLVERTEEKIELEAHNIEFTARKPYDDYLWDYYHGKPFKYYLPRREYTKVKIDVEF
jgi:hypothetical protein